MSVEPRTNGRAGNERVRHVHVGERDGLSGNVRQPVWTALLERDGARIRERQLDRFPLTEESIAHGVDQFRSRRGRGGHDVQRCIGSERWSRIGRQEAGCARRREDSRSDWAKRIDMAQAREMAQFVGGNGGGESDEVRARRRDLLGGITQERIHIYRNRSREMDVSPVQLVRDSARLLNALDRERRPVEQNRRERIYRAALSELVAERTEVRFEPGLNRIAIRLGVLAFARDRVGIEIQIDDLRDSVSPIANF